MFIFLMRLEHLLLIHLALILLTARLLNILLLQAAAAVEQVVAAVPVDTKQQLDYQLHHKLTLLPLAGAAILLPKGLIVPLGLY